MTKHNKAKLPQNKESRSQQKVAAFSLLNNEQFRLILRKLGCILPYVVVAVTTYLFFAFAYRGHLHYSEQLQMFQFTNNYLIDNILPPGGFSNYIGLFVTQFMYFAAIGSIFIALIFTVIYILVAYILRGCKLRIPWAILCTANVIAAFFDKDCLVGGLVAILLGLVFIVVFQRIKHQKAKNIVLPIMAILLYWLAGALPAGTLVIWAILENIRLRKLESYTIISLIISFFVVIAAPHVARQIFGLWRPVSLAYIGVDYYRFVPIIVIWPFILCALIAVTPLISMLFANAKKVLTIIVSSLALLFSVGLLAERLDMETETKLMYDFYGRTRQWKKIIAMAEEKSPTDQCSVVYLNLALGMTNQIGERLFDFYQNSPSGLVPLFKIDIDLPIAGSEVFYHLGMINTSERWAFEANQSIPNYQMSSRCIVRLAETNIINENYDVAKKYLYILRTTIFYKEWAELCLKHIEQHSTATVGEWQTLRERRTADDFLFSDQECDQMLGLLYQSNRQNKLAYDYLMSFCLLNCNVQKYVTYAPIGKQFYHDLPRAFLEAHLYYMSIKHPELIEKQRNMYVQSTLRRMNEFRKIYQKNKKDPELEKRFSKTLWYYMLCR